MEVKNLYILSCEETENINDIVAVFDSKDLVNTFNERFPENERLHLIEIELNPKFIPDKFRIPYFVHFDLEEYKPTSVRKLCFIDDCERASRQETRLTENTFEIYLFASSEENAINAARKKRAELLPER